MVKRRKVPLRRCAGCREMRDKKELLRIVFNEDEGFSVDPSGRKNGRGSYICKNPSCFASAFKSRGLERSFRKAVPRGVYERLKEEIDKIGDES
jgi:predicted RNA-binding protein YlxR (DUF448 family)